MKNLNANNTTVKILDKMYHVKCPPDKVQELQNAAVYVDEQMKKIRDTGKITSTERMAVITALNIAYELLNSNKIGNNDSKRVSQYIQNMQKKVEKILVQQESLGFIEEDKIL